MLLSALKEEDRLEKIQQFFQKHIWESKIIDYKCNEINGEIILECTLQNRRKTTILFRKLYTVGFEERRFIAGWSNRIRDERLRKIVKNEVVLMVNSAFQLGYISTDNYKQFCISNNCTIRPRSLGLDMTVEGINPHPIPEEIAFVERMYVKTYKYEGLYYKDPTREECFQDIKSIASISLCYCISLLKECRDRQCKPFRMILVSWLFNNLLKIKKIRGVENKVDRIIVEYQQLHNKSNEEIKRLIK